MRKEAGYKIRLTARNEGIMYVDDTGTYRFRVSLENREWVIRVPPSRGDAYKLINESDANLDRILPRVTQYLTKIYWFGLFPQKYTVRVSKA